MRRQNPMSVRVRAPSRGLVTRWPSESADLLATQGVSYGVPGIANRAAVVSSNTRYEDGVACNAPGYERISIVTSILQGLLANWHLDEASGTRFDSTLAHRDLTDQPGVTIVATQGNMFISGNTTANGPAMMINIFYVVTVGWQLGTNNGFTANTSAGTLTCNTPGTYNLSAVLHWGALLGSAGHHYTVTVFKNGVATGLSFSGISSVVDASASASISGLITLANSDILDIRIEYTTLSGTVITVDTATFSIVSINGGSVATPDVGQTPGKFNVAAVFPGTP